MSTAEQIPQVRLSDGREIPQVGLGVFKVPDDVVARLVVKATDVGYRSIDTASVYRNESGVGEGIRQCGVPREDLFVTTKVWNTDQGYDETLTAFEASRQRLGLDYVDLYLVHWPAPTQDRYAQTWRALIRLRDDGLVRSIGVSNFNPDHLQRVVDETGEVPVVNQVELHPAFQQAALRDLHARLGIVTEAWSPLARGAPLLDPLIIHIAEHHQKSAAQVVLRWHVQLGNVVIPKTATESRLPENLDIFDFELSEHEMDRIAGLQTGTRSGPDPATLD